MPTFKRNKTKYPGVFYIEGKSISGKPERIYYIRYKINGKLIEDKVGRQYKDDMTPARASQLRTQRIEGGQLSNRARRDKQKEKKWTVNELWEEYNIQNTLKGYKTDRSRFEKYLKPSFGSRKPSEIAQLDVDRVRINLLKALSPQTVKHVLALLRRIINFGVGKRLCKPLSFEITMPKVNNEKTEDLTPDQIAALFRSIEEDTHPHAGAMMKLSLFTGMRRGELFRLKWDDVDYNRGFIAIRNPKGGQDEKIPLNDGAESVLKNHAKAGSEYVFPGRNGGQRTTIRTQVNRIKKRAGLPDDFRALHGLRHVYASMLASSGEVDMYTLQKLLTHKDPKMTQRYAHLRDEALKRASSVADSILESTLKKE